MKARDIFGSRTCIGIFGAMAQASLSPAFASASVQTMGNIGDANRASGLIRHFTLHAETRVIEAVAAVPSGGVSLDVVRKVTVETAHDICADPRGSGWTLRLFLPDQSTPIATCRFR